MSFKKAEEALISLPASLARILFISSCEKGAPKPAPASTSSCEAPFSCRYISGSLSSLSGIQQTKSFSVSGHPCFLQLLTNSITMFFLCRNTTWKDLSTFLVGSYAIVAPHSLWHLKVAMLLLSLNRMCFFVHIRSTIIRSSAIISTSIRATSVVSTGIRTASTVAVSLRRLDALLQFRRLNALECLGRLDAQLHFKSLNVLNCLGKLDALERFGRLNALLQFRGETLFYLSRRKVNRGKVLASIGGSRKLLPLSRCGNLASIRGREVGLPIGRHVDFSSIRGR